METINENLNNTKQRHVFVAFWFCLMIVGNTLAAIRYLFAGVWIVKKLPEAFSTPMVIALGILSVANVFFSILLYRWKKWGFYGLIITTICAIIINLSVGLSIGQSYSGLVGMAILYGILQIKKNNVTAWKNLE